MVERGLRCRGLSSHRLIYRYSNIALSIPMWPFGWKMHGRRGLRMWTLSLIARGPKNGAEIVDAIEQMTQGWWRPSPGSIYPLLAELQQEELVQKRGDRRGLLPVLPVRLRLDLLPAVLPLLLGHALVGRLGLGVRPPALLAIRR